MPTAAKEGRLDRYVCGGGHMERDGTGGWVLLAAHEAALKPALERAEAAEKALTEAQEDGARQLHWKEDYRGKLEALNDAIAELLDDETIVREEAEALLRTKEFNDQDQNLGFAEALALNKIRAALLQPHSPSVDRGKLEVPQEAVEAAAKWLYEEMDRSPLYGSPSWSKAAPSAQKANRQRARDLLAVIYDQALLDYREKLLGEVRPKANRPDAERLRQIAECIEKGGDLLSSTPVFLGRIADEYDPALASVEEAEEVCSRCGGDVWLDPEASLAEVQRCDCTGKKPSNTQEADHA